MITTFDQYVDASFNRPQSFFAFPQQSLVSTAVSQFSWWTLSGYSGNGATPATGSGATCTSATQGAPSLQAPTGGRLLYLAPCGFVVTVSASFNVSDRLVHTSGLDGTLNTSQTVNTVALPARGGTGVGVYAACEVYTATGATTVTATCTYTNSSGTSGKTSTASFLGSAVGRFIVFPWATGDVGVQSVQSIQLSATTGGAGNFGVTLFKPIANIPPGGASSTTVAQSIWDQGTSQIDANTCLFFTSQGSSTFTLCSWNLGVVEGLTMDGATLSSVQFSNEKSFQGVLQTNISFTAPLMGSVFAQANPWGTGVATTTAGRQCTNATAGALPLPLFAYEGTELRIVRARYMSFTSNGTVYFYDRLVDYGGFDATLTTSQTFGAQTLPRSTTGYQVLPFLEVYATASSAASTATVTYTNSVGTTGRTATYSLPASWGTIGRVYPLLLQSGDLGVRSVQSVQLGSASAAAGNWGVTLGRVLTQASTNSVTAFNNTSPLRDLTNTLSLSFDTTACLTYFACTAAGWGSTTFFYTVV